MKLIKNRSDNIFKAYVFRIVFGTLLVFLIFLGGSGALSDAAVSDDVRDNYPDIESSNGNFPDYPPGIHNLYPQRAEQFSNPASAENIPFQTAATGDVNITKIGHFGGLTYTVEVSGNYAYTGQGSTFVVLDISDKMAPAEVGKVETNGTIT